MKQSNRVKGTDIFLFIYLYTHLRFKVNISVLFLICNQNREVYYQMKRLLTGNYTRWKHKNAGEVALLRGLLINVCCCHWEHLEGFRFHWHNLMIYVTTSLVNLTFRRVIFLTSNTPSLCCQSVGGFWRLFFGFGTKRYQEQGKGVQQVIRIFDFKKKQCRKVACKIVSTFVN